jgi:hypothetical protein
MERKGIFLAGRKRGKKRRGTKRDEHWLKEDKRQLGLLDFFL